MQTFPVKILMCLKIIESDVFISNYCQNTSKIVVCNAKGSILHVLVRYDSLAC